MKTLAALFLMTAAGATYADVLGFGVRAGFVSARGTNVALAVGFDAPVLNLKVPAFPLGARLQIAGDFYGDGGFRNTSITLQARGETGALAVFVGAGPSWRNLDGDTALGLDFQVGVSTALSGLPIPASVEFKYIASHHELSGLGAFLAFRF